MRARAWLRLIAIDQNAARSAKRLGYKAEEFSVYKTADGRFGWRLKNPKADAKTGGKMLDP
jgi:hypothetical protein